MKGTAAMDSGTMVAVEPIVVPVTVSPRISAHWIGAAPRYFGSRLVWVFRKPCCGTASREAGRILP